ncbi:PREDICTED: subtilisin-like protease SBT3.1 [Nelumbo nucifera]|uniref:Subtilisin-like protease SBT3.1 n=1 Tax=Nelumbo nucifera TaxID=4432 RepID=A0A1U8Q683_NELNU|nr:PREDICTED: subtilisin-like protease SBT3.1 [Nelumbo nucifera]
MPKRFKGKCVPEQNFTMANCNRKIIGAQYYLKGLEATARRSLESLIPSFLCSARAENGHGTHTASIAVGSAVSDTSLFGIGAIAMMQ